MNCPSPSAKVLLEFQSKAGFCRLDNFDLFDNDIPAVIAADLINQLQDCKKCGSTIKISGKVVLWCEEER